MKDKIESIIKSSLKPEYEFLEIENLMWTSGDDEITISDDEFCVNIKNKNNEIFWIDLKVDPKNSNIIMIEFSYNLLANFQEILFNTEDIINKLKESAYYLCFFNAYCFGKNIKVPICKNIEDLIVKDISLGNTSFTNFLSMSIGESKVSIYSEINLEKEQMIHNLYLVASRNENDISIKCESWSEYEEFKKDVLREWAAKPLNKQVEELKMEDYKLLHMINY